MFKDYYSLIFLNLFSDRNVFNAQEDPSSNRYGDIFFIEPGSVEANRIRDQLEKDEKDLPSYDEVMRMCNLTTPTAAAAGMPVPQSPLGVPSPIGIAALPAPPYSETDPHSSSAAEATVIAMEPMEPSTSRAAQIPPSSGSGPPAPLPTTAVWSVGGMDKLELKHSPCHSGPHRCHFVCAFSTEMNLCDLIEYIPI